MAANKYCIKYIVEHPKHNYPSIYQTTIL